MREADALKLLPEPQRSVLAGILIEKLNTVVRQNTFCVNSDRFPVCRAPEAIKALRMIQDIKDVIVECHT